MLQCCGCLVPHARVVGSCFRQSHKFTLQGELFKTIHLSRQALISLSQASQSLLFRNFTFSVVVASALISVSRILALWHYYHAPLTLAFDFQYNEIPHLLKATGLLPIYSENMPEEDIPLIDLSPVKQFDLKLCLSKEWHRFPGNYLVFKWSLLKASLMGYYPDILRRRKRMTLTLWT